MTELNKVYAEIEKLYKKTTGTKPEDYGYRTALLDVLFIITNARREELTNLKTSHNENPMEKTV